MLVLVRNILFVAPACPAYRQGRTHKISPASHRHAQPLAGGRPWLSFFLARKTCLRLLNPCRIFLRLKTFSSKTFGLGTASLRQSTDCRLRAFRRPNPTRPYKIIVSQSFALSSLILCPV